MGGMMSTLGGILDFGFPILDYRYSIFEFRLWGRVIGDSLGEILYGSSIVRNVALQ